MSYTSKSIGIIFLSSFLVWSLKAEFIVVIDPGHGGEVGDGRIDPETGEAVERGVKSYGASWNNATSPSGIKEKTLTLEYSKEIKKVFQQSQEANQLGISVFLTREEDVHMSAMSRAARAIQAKADVFVSLHFNAYSEKADPSKTYKYGEVKKVDGQPRYFAQGTRAFVARKNNPNAEYLKFYNPYFDADKKFATSLANSVGASLDDFRNPADKPKHGFYSQPSGFKDGIRVLGYVRQEPSMYRSVSCLLEVEFITSPSVDEYLLQKNREQARKSVATAFVEAVCEHLKSFDPPKNPIKVQNP